MKNGNNFVENLISTISELKNILAEELGDTQDAAMRRELRKAYADEIAWLKQDAKKHYVGNIEFETICAIA